MSATLGRAIGRRGITAAAVAAVVVPIGLSALVSPASAAPSTQASDVYIVQVSGAPVATYTGGKPGLARTKPLEGERVDTRTPAAKAYAASLRKQHVDVLAKAKVSTGAKKVDYTTAFNGFSVKLTQAQAKVLAKTAGVVRIWKDEKRFGDTIGTPDFLGMTGSKGVWQTKLGGQSKAGLGMIIGIIDSGVWPENPSFAALPEPRPDAALIAKKWNGTCQTGETEPVACNNKLIGARYYTENATIEPFEFVSPRDYNGHGSHTGATAGGNMGVQASINGQVVGTASGMAPQARLSYYKALWATPDDRASGSTADLVHAIDDAVADGVDVINYSISGSSTYVVSPDEIAFLNAADAGVFVSTSAGNSGDTVGESSVAHNSPWTMTVAASSHDRGAVKSTTTGDGATYTGVGVGGGVSSAALVESSAVALPGVDATAASLCYLDADLDPANGDQPTLDPAQVAGKIVVCTRGTNARVDKSRAVADAGGIGMILVNTSDAQSLNADFHSVPTVHLNATDGSEIKNYAATDASPTASISATDTSPVRAPEMAGFSSYGPALAGGGDLLKPDITAPGVDIIAAVAPPGNAGNDFNAYSGTSMSAPHIAGIAALVGQKHPLWSPMAVKSALMTTASPLDNTGQPIQRAGANATPLDYGSGHVVVNKAFNPGLVYESNALDWIRYACGLGQLQLITDASFCATYGSIDPSNLNYPSISVGDLAGSQTITRTVTNITPRGERYVAQVTAPAGFTATVSPKQFTVPARGSKSFTVTLTRTTAPVGEWAFGSLSWVGGQGHVVTSPIAVRPVAISAPASVSGSGADGSTSVTVMPGFSGSLSTSVVGLAAGAVALTPSTLDEDGLATIEIPEGTTQARFATYDADVPAGTDIDIYVIKDGALVGQSAGGSSEESVVIDDPEPGTYQVDVDLFAGPASLDVPVVSFALTGDEGNLTVVPATTSVTTGTPVDLTFSWSGLDAATRYVGWVAYSDGTSEVGRTTVAIN